MTLSINKLRVRPPLDHILSQRQPDLTAMEIGPSVWTTNLQVDMYICHILIYTLTRGLMLQDPPALVNLVHAIVYTH